MRPSFARVLPLLLLLLLLGPASPARAVGGALTVAGAGDLVGPGNDPRPAARAFGVSATIGEDGRARGVVAYLDPDAHLRMRAETIDQLTVADGVATLVGSARVAGEG